MTDPPPSSPSSPLQQKPSAPSDLSDESRPPRHQLPLNIDRYTKEEDDAVASGEAALEAANSAENKIEVSTIAFVSPPPFSEDAEASGEAALEAANSSENKIEVRVGVKWRAYWGSFSGAGFSFMDTISDIIMFFQYRLEGNYMFAYGIALTVFMNIFLQLILVSIQNRKMSKAVLATEALKTVLCVKVGFDAAKVARGDEKDILQIIDPEFEMLITRGLDILTESVPSSLMQAYAFILSRHKSKIAATSILLSGAAIGFVATTITWDWDTNPKKRKEEPLFNGFIKNYPATRTLTFLSMLGISTTHALSRVLAMALVLVVNGSWLCLYLLADVVVFFLVKVLRRDVRIRLSLQGKAGLFGSVLIKGCAKLLVDFTGLGVGRIPFQLGGAQWCFAIVQNQLFCIGAVVMYIKSSVVEGEEEVGGVDDGETVAPSVSLSLPPTDGDDLLWNIVLPLFAVWCISSITFIVVIDHDYLHTFYSTITGGKFCILNYENATTDEGKMNVFAVYPGHWLSIRGNVREYTHRIGRGGRLSFRNGSTLISSSRLTTTSCLS